MNVLITGYNGFIGKNLILSLKNIKKINIQTFGKENNLADLENLISKCSLIFHLAGENRNKKDKNFTINNTDLTSQIVEIIKKKKKKISLIFSSTSQINKKKNIYSKSKIDAENILKKNSNQLFRVKIYRFTNVYGKWSKPNYNSVVATFCHNLSRNKKVHLSKTNEILDLLYIDDVVSYFLADIRTALKKKYELISKFPNTHKITVHDLAKKINFFKKNRTTLLNNIELAYGFDKFLYSTYLSYIPFNNFQYSIDLIKDARGSFFEFLKSKKNGQISVLIVKPKMIRGNHYHMTKVEKFFILSGKGNFLFKNMISDEKKVISINSKNQQIVESIPGWAHSIMNTGKNDLIVLLWSNEIFNKENADTFPYNLNQ